MQLELSGDSLKVLNNVLDYISQKIIFKINFPFNLYYSGKSIHVY